MKQIIIAIGWGCSTFAAGLLTLDLTPLGVNGAAIGLVALALNTLGGVLYVAAGRSEP
jgi:hypothetical protein